LLRLTTFANIGNCLRLFEKKPEGAWASPFFQKDEARFNGIFLSRSVKHSLKKPGERPQGFPAVFLRLPLSRLRAFLRERK
jgi:hypothetical protein